MDNLTQRFSSIRVEYILIVIIFLGLLLGVWLGSHLGNDSSKYADPVVIKIADDPQNKARFVVFGDSGNGSAEQLRMAKLLDNENFDAVLHVGDVSQGKGTAEEYQKFFDEIYSTKIKSVLYPTPGNHDYLTDDLKAYLDYFSLPAQQLNILDSERYYSVDIENVHVVSLDTNRLLDEISDSRQDDMADWLTADLQKVEKTNAIVVIEHHPPFNIGKHGADQRVLDKLVPIYQQYGVDLVLSGHDHNYQRTCPLVYSNQIATCQSGGVFYVVTGGGGQSLYDLPEAIPAYMEAAKSTHHYVRFSVDKFGVVSLKAVDQNGEIFDQVSFSINRY